MTTGTQLVATASMIFVGGCITEFPDPCAVGPPWLAEMDKRRPIMLSNPADEALEEGFQLRVPLDGLADSDVAVQFWDSAGDFGSAIVTHAIDGRIAIDEAPFELWFRLQRPLAAGAQDACSYWLYDERASGEPAPSEPEQVFDLYGDFVGQRPEGWSTVGDTNLVPGPQGTRLDGTDAGIASEEGVPLDRAMDVTVFVEGSLTDAFVAFIGSPNAAGWQLGGTPTARSATPYIGGMDGALVDGVEDTSLFTVARFDSAAELRVEPSASAVASQTLAGAFTSTAQMGIHGNGMFLVRVRTRHAVPGAAPTVGLGPEQTP